MVSLKHSVVLLTLAASSCLAAPQPVVDDRPVIIKRLFSLWDIFGTSSSTTSTTTTTSSSSTSSSIKTTSISSTSSTIASTSSIKTTSATPTTSSTTTSTTTSSTTSSSSIVTTSSTSSSASATSSNAPVFTGLSAIVSGSDKIGTYTLSSYSASSCASLCAANAACVFYDVYYASTLLSLVLGSTPYCALYSSAHTAADATDSGTVSGMSYSSSAGYLLKGSSAAVVSSSSSAISTKASSMSAASSSSSTAVSSSAALANLAAVVPTTSVALTSAASVVIKTTSISVAVTMPTTSVSIPTTSVMVSMPSTTVAVSVKTTSVALPTSSLVPSATVSTSAACAVPTWAYSGWCKTLPSMVPNMLLNAANSASLNKGYIIPLYIYPAWWSTPGAWDWIYTAATNNPSITFTVIINPASGPGTGAVPNTDYQHEIVKMAAISNIYMLGYVDTAFGSRSPSAVSGDISLYAGWAASNSAFAMDGIFFDNQASSSSYLSMYTSYATQVRSNSGFLSGTVGMAPGQICDPSFVDLADFTIIFEDVSSNVQSDIFGWYSSFLGGLSTSQLTKIVWMLSAADSTTAVAISNIQAAMNPKYLYMTDNTGQWGSQFQAAPSSSFLTTALGMISSPLSKISSLVAT